MKPATMMAIGAGVLALAGAAWLVYRKGGVSEAAGAVGEAIGTGAVKAADGAVTGAVGTVGAGIGVPTPGQVTTDPLVARWLIDTEGYFPASQWSSAPALMQAIFLAAGSGSPPPAGSAVALRFGTGGSGLTTGDFTRMDHDTTPVFTGGASGGW
ncbi:hypothetical protein [Piscinibacter sp.]|uniref:hypothetical protein n=1 Tax=Piscinibacter sp. TaxID=1903157 RepID=UPI0039E68CE1